ncbi:hypothetical protein BH09MYX1_BH09MYX1_65520 [soil metagenome]
MGHGPRVPGSHPARTPVVGDNRNQTFDSRAWFDGKGGGVPSGNVRGRLLARWLSITPLGVDWSRGGVALSEPLLPTPMSSLAGDLKRCLDTRPPDEKTVPPAAP